MFLFRGAHESALELQQKLGLDKPEPHSLISFYLSVFLPLSVFLALCHTHLHRQKYSSILNLILTCESDTHTTPLSFFLYNHSVPHYSEPPFSYSLINTHTFSLTFFSCSFTHILICIDSAEIIPFLLNNFKNLSIVLY